MELESESSKAAAAILSGSQIRHRRAVSLTEEIVDPDIDYRDSLVSKSANISDDEEADYAESDNPSFPLLLQQLCGFDYSTMELLAMPGRAIDKAEDVARYLWKTVPGLSLEKAEEIARSAWDMGPGLAIDKAEEIAKRLWEAVPEMPLEKAEEIARHVWESVPLRARVKAEELVRQTWEAGRAVIHHSHLPKWMRDNDYLVKGHRPPLNSFWACFKSIFRIHTETGNIWTHLIGCIAFVVLTMYFLTRPSVEIEWEEKIVFSAFFAGAILCLTFSWLFHTVYCHSERVGRFFSKLDYCGIALLIVGSFVPWLYYSFYCRQSPQIIYLVLIIVLGIISIIVSMWDKFGEPKFRTLRAAVFVALGLSGVIPACHYVITEGFYHAWNTAAFGWLLLMAFLYIAGAVIYAARIPECIWPGKFDIWFQSHQIFHVFVVAAAFIHYHGMSEVASNHMAIGTCLHSSSV